MRPTNLGRLLALASAISFIGCAKAEKSPEAAEQSAKAAGKQAQIGAAKADGQAYQGHEAPTEGGGGLMMHIKVAGDPNT